MSLTAKRVFVLSLLTALSFAIYLSNSAQSDYPVFLQEDANTTDCENNNLTVFETTSWNNGTVLIRTPLLTTLSPLTFAGCPNTRTHVVHFELNGRQHTLTGHSPCIDFIWRHVCDNVSSSCYARAPYPTGFWNLPVTSNDLAILRMKATAVRARSPSQVARSPHIRLAFFILGGRHEQKRIISLIRVLAKPTHRFVVSIPGSLTYVRDQLADLKVHFLEEFETSWGGISLVYSELAALLLLAQYSDWDYYINLSASDFPLITIEEMEAKLTRLNGTSIVHFSKNESLDFKRRVRLLFLECSWNGIFRPHALQSDSPRMKLTEDEEDLSWKTSQWHVLTHSFVNAILACNKCWELVWRLRYSLIPDEAFFGIVLGRQLLGTQLPVLNDHSHYKTWGYDINCTEWSRLVTELNRGRPQLFFARKLTQDGFDCALHLVTSRRRSSQ